MKQLSKSKYAKFCQCPKCLWLSEYKPLQEVTSGTGTVSHYGEQTLGTLRLNARADGIGAEYLIIYRRD